MIDLGRNHAEEEFSDWVDVSISNDRCLPERDIGSAPASDAAGYRSGGNQPFAAITWALSVIRRSGPSLGDA